MDFNYIDGFVILILAYSFYKGFSKGFVLVLATFVALILGVAGAIYFSDVVAIKLQENTEIDGQYISITAFTLTFIGIIVGVHFLARVVNQMIKIVALAPLNKIMGGVFNVAKSAVILCVAFYVFDFINHQFTLVQSKTLKSSFAYSGLVATANTIIPSVTNADWYEPHKWQNMVDDFKDEVLPEEVR
jgi:membrane protein required for colicin V production